jgi:hypothetical protein
LDQWANRTNTRHLGPLDERFSNRYLIQKRLIRGKLVDVWASDLEGREKLLVNLRKHKPGQMFSSDSSLPLVLNEINLD